MLEELRKRLAMIAAALLAIETAATTDKRSITPDEATKVETLSVEFDNIKREIEARERIQRITAAAGESSGRRTMPGGLAIVRADRAAADNGGFTGGIAEFARAVHEGCRQGGQVDERLSRLRARPAAAGENGHIVSAPSGWQNEGSGGDLGYLVPPEMRADIWELVFNGQDLINTVPIEPTSSNAVDLFSDESTPWSATGVKAKWRAEASQMVNTGKETVDPRTVRLQELYAFVSASNELLEDAPRLQNRLTVKAAEAIRWESSEALMWGNGVGRPLGWMRSPAVITVAAEAGQATATVVRQNIWKMFIRLLALGTASPGWFLNRDVLPALAEMSLGNNGLFMLPGTGIVGAPNGQLLGIPLNFSEHCKTLGTSGDLQLADTRGYYAIGKTGGVKFDSSIHLYFDYGLTAFRWTFRIGGQPFLSAPISPANGTATRSHFVALADRP